jgi:transposase
MYFTAGMPNPYDVALRERAVKAYESGEGSYSQLATLFDVDMRTLERWVARWRATGTVAPKPRGGGWRCPIDLTVLHAVVREVPDATVNEFCWQYNRRVPRAQRTTPTSFRRAMRRAGFVLKKNGRGRARSTGPMSPRSAKRS